jgi:hypothetical protein
LELGREAAEVYQRAECVRGRVVDQENDENVGDRADDRRVGAGQGDSDPVARQFGHGADKAKDQAYEIGDSRNGEAETCASKELVAPALIAETQQGEPG